MISKGKFIVLDGTDGTGKATQTKLLAEKLQSFGIEVETADFPQYGHKSSGLVEEYLNGKYGPADEVGAYRASIFYAVDRYDASFQIKKWLDEGKTVISNRYVTANMGHQGGKIKDNEERKNYFTWLDNLEYNLFGIPKPDLNIILHIDAEIAQQLVDKKGSRDYVGGQKRDIHEADIEHLRNAEKVYYEIGSILENASFIECTKNNELMSKSEISDLIWADALNILCTNKDYFNKIFPTVKSPSNESCQTAPNFLNFYGEQPKPSCLKVERITPNAKLPTRAHDSDAGLDIYSNNYYSIMPGQRAIIHTGIKMAIPENYSGLIWDKSGIAKSGIVTTGGVLDSGYRGEIMVNVINLSQDSYSVTPGQKIAQLLIQKVEYPEIIEDIIDDVTSRNEGSFGSTGLF